MPASFEIDPVRRLVRSRAWGVLVDTDFVATQAGLRLDPDFEPSFDQLYDFREVTEIRVTGDGLFNLSRTSPFAIDARRAFVVGTDVAFGMARMYELSRNRDPAVFRIFRDPESASRWLEG